MLGSDDCCGTLFFESLPSIEDESPGARNEVRRTSRGARRKGRVDQ